MKKRFLLIPAIGLPLLTIIPTICLKTNMTSIIKVVSTQTDAFNRYAVHKSSWTHYAVGEKLDLRDLKVTYNDPEKGAIDVTSQCNISMQNGQELTQEGEFDVNITHNNFHDSFKIYVEKEPHEVPCIDNIQKLGAINVKFKLMSNQECIFTDYDSGEGTLEIPDCVDRDGIKYFIKQIPSNWSDGENDITGLKFKEGISHLKKICNGAFRDTNCLDFYIDNKSELLKFPEGLEEIGEYAFNGTDYGQHKIRGYSFPSTLKKIDSFAFRKAPYIDGDDNNGELQFRSIPQIADNAFYILGAPSHDCKWIYGNTLDIAKAMHNMLKGSDDFNSSNDFLIPRLIGDDYCEIIDDEWGDITVKCALTSDECLLLGYSGGFGKLIIPDHVVCNDKNYYVKEILSNCFYDKFQIDGVEFAKDCTHLKKICDGAFEGTNCQIEYTNDDSTSLMIFPEGLEEIGANVFAWTDSEINQRWIRGYSFPSTLKKIGYCAFGKTCHISGNNRNNGELYFKSVPEIDKDAFHIEGEVLKHNCKYVYGKTQEIAEQIVKLIKDNMSDSFNTSSDYLIPKIIKK